MMDLCRKLEGLASQLDTEGIAGRKHEPLRRADGQTLRTASHVICKLAAECESLRRLAQGETR